MKTPRGIAPLVLAMLVVLSGAVGASASPDLIEEDEARPTDSSLLRATTGQVLAYRLIVSDTLISSRLTILDKVARARRTFILTFSAKVDGRRLSCSYEGPRSFGDDLAKQLKLCAKLPSVVAGKTNVVILYWAHTFHGPHGTLDDYAFSDEVWTIAR